jgi:hypothetical protein
MLENDKDFIKLTVPLAIKLLEFAREKAESDLNLHFIAENLVELSKRSEVIDMKDFKRITLSTLSQ